MPMLALGTGAGAEATSAQPSARMRSVRSNRSITWADEEDERPVSRHLFHQLHQTSSLSLVVVM